ncbi:MAG: hypothetical protein K2J17_02375 [Paramuribaculum sp.]|nr:hypothetical protein [Paramuribaculum sp.]
MTRSQIGIYSQEFAQLNTASLNNLKSMRNDGYGAHMIFAMDPVPMSMGGNRYDYYINYQLNALRNVATAFYDDELVDDGKRYPKDWD